MKKVNKKINVLMISVSFQTSSHIFGTTYHLTFFSNYYASFHAFSSFRRNFFFGEQSENASFDLFILDCRMCFNYILHIV